MKVVLQRVKEAQIEINGSIHSSINKGLLTLMGLEQHDTMDSIKKTIDKIINYRCFEDENGKMNLSLKDIQGEHLLVSQFTLAADVSKGRRPGFQSAMKPELANTFFAKGVEYSNSVIETQSGVFQANMKVHLINDGPVTFVFES